MPMVFKPPILNLGSGQYSKDYYFCLVYTFCDLHLNVSYFFIATNQTIDLQASVNSTDRKIEFLVKLKLVFHLAWKPIFLWQLLYYLSYRNPYGWQKKSNHIHLTSLISGTTFATVFFLYKNIINGSIILKEILVKNY